MVLRKNSNIGKKIGKIVFFILTISLVVFVLGKTNGLTFKKAKSASKVVKQNSDNEQYLIFFFFKMKNKIGIKPSHQNFGKQEKIFVNKKKLSSGKIKNYLNFFKKNGEKYFGISPLTLEKTVKKKNFIVYQPLNILKIGKQRSQINIHNLAKINLNAEKLQISLSIGKKIIKTIQDNKNSFLEVKKIINYYCQTKLAKLLIEKLINNVGDG